MVRWRSSPPITHPRFIFKRGIFITICHLWLLVLHRSTLCESNMHSLSNATSRWAKSNIESWYYMDFKETLALGTHLCVSYINFKYSRTTGPKLKRVKEKVFPQKGKSIEKNGLCPNKVFHLFILFQLFCLFYKAKAREWWIYHQLYNYPNPKLISFTKCQRTHLWKGMHIHFTEFGKLLSHRELKKWVLQNVNLISERIFILVWHHHLLTSSENKNPTKRSNPRPWSKTKDWPDQ